MKTCTQCCDIKSFDNFYVCGKNKLGEPRYTPKCRDCTNQERKIKRSSDLDLQNKEKEYAKQYREKCKVLGKQPNKKVYSPTRHIKNYSSILGRARAMLKSAKRREYKGSDFNLDLEFILDKLTIGVCEVTGIPFNYDKPNGITCNKFSPSLDRVDNNTGYIKSNVQVVIWQYNLMKGQISDNELLEICQAVVNKHRGE